MDGKLRIQAARDRIIKHIIQKFVVAAIAVSAATHSVAATVIIDDRAAHIESLSAVSDRVASVHAMAKNEESAALVTSLKAIGGDQAMDPVLRDYLLETTILALSGTTPTALSRAAVEEYQHRAVSSFIRLRDEHGNAVIPLYDLAAAARLTIRVWDVSDAKARVSEALRVRQWTPADLLQTPAEISGSAWQEGTRQAFESVDRQLLLEQKASLLHAQRDSNQFDTLLLVMAVQLRDRDLYNVVLTMANPRDALEAVGSINTGFHHVEAAEILILAAARDEVASAAILELGKLVSNDDMARGWLLERLASPGDGGSAALALARVGDTNILSDIESIIKSDAPELAKLRAALVLRLSNTEAAQALRQDLLTRKLSSEQLREALQ
jgi:hypothetical protein